MADVQDKGFYEDDEPVADIVAAFERGEKQTTAAPRGVNKVFLLHGGGLTHGRNESQREIVTRP